MITPPSILDSVNGQVLTVGAASVRSTVLPAGQTLLVVSTTACWIKQGTNAVTAAAAAAGNTYLPANFPIIIKTPLDTTNYGYLAAIQAAAGGSLSITVLMS